MLCPPIHSDWWRVSWILVIVFFLPSFTVLAQDITPFTCSESLNEAQDQLTQGAFDEVIALIQPCIEADSYSTITQLTKAYELLANVYIAINDEQQARETITSLLQANPSYEPDPNQSRSDYVLLIYEMKTLLPPETPVLTSIAPTDSAIIISWEHLDITAVSYTVFKGTSQFSLEPLVTLSTAELLEMGDNSGLTVSYFDTDFNYDTRYFYALEAIKGNDVRSARSQIVAVQTGLDPNQDGIAGGAGSRSKKKVSPWVFVGGGVAVGGLIAILSGGGGGGGDDPPPVASGDGELPFPEPVP